MPLPASCWNGPTSKISTEDIVENVLEPLRGELAGSVTDIEEKAVTARREGDGFVIETDRGRLVHGQIGDMSRRRGAGPSLKQIYTAQEYAVRAVNAIDGRLRRARREAILRRRGG
jgi:hypothetical protein